MSECTRCGKQLSFSDRINAKSYGGKCIACTSQDLNSEKEVASGHTYEEIQKKYEEAERLTLEVSSILLTTETAPNLKITKRIEIITAEVAFGMNIFKDLFTEVRNVVGGRSKAVQNTLRDARRAALNELKKEAHEVGANAVVGIDLNYVALSAGAPMVMLVASGTAVLVEN